METRIELRRNRDFSGVLNVAFSFLMKHGLSMIKGVIIIGAPILVVSCICFALFMNGYLELLKGAIDNRFGNNNTALQEADFVIYVLLFMLSYIASFLILTAVVNAYVILYVKGQDKITPSDIWNEAKKHLLNITISTIIFSLTMTIAFVMLVICFIGMSTLEGIPGFIRFLIVFTGIIGTFLAFFFFAVRLSLFHIAAMQENRGGFDSLSRSLALTQGHFWSTFGIYFISSLMQNVVSYVCAIPFYAIIVVTMMHDISNKGGSSPMPVWANGIASVVLILGTFLSFIIVLVFSAAQYYALVEKKEHVGLMADLNTLGMPNEDE